MGPRKTALFSVREFPRLGAVPNRGKKEGRTGLRPISRPPPPKIDWERETRALDDELTIQIERLVEKRRRLRDTVDDVSNRPPLSRSTREGQGSQPPRAPPSAPAGNTGVEKGEKKKKKKTGDAPVIAGVNSPPSGKPPGKPRVVGVETLRDRDMVRISRGPPEESWVEVVRRKRKPATTTPRSQPLPSTRAATDKAGARAPARGEAAPKAKLQRPPGSSAVTLTCPPGRYEAYMR